MHEKSDASWTVLSAGAFLVIALICGAVVWWVFGGVVETHKSIHDYAPSARVAARAGRVTIGMVLLGVLAAIGALFFAAVGLYTLWLGMTDFRHKKAKQDESWRDMPYPKG